MNHTNQQGEYKERGNSKGEGGGAAGQPTDVVPPTSEQGKGPPASSSLTNDQRLTTNTLKQGQPPTCDHCDEVCAGGSPTPEAPCPEIDSAKLLQGRNCLVIVHHGERYRLVETRNGKLMLQK